VWFRRMKFVRLACRPWAVGVLALLTACQRAPEPAPHAAEDALLSAQRASAGVQPISAPKDTNSDSGGTK
jgi:hypothetical protein